MSEPGLTTPLQPVRRDRGLGPIAVGAVLVVIIGVIVWRPWSAANRGPDGADAGASQQVLVGGSPSADPTTLGTNAASDAFAGSDLFAGPTQGPWSGLVTGEWSIVAFVRPYPLSRDPLDLRQQPVAVFVGPPAPHTEPRLFCDASGTFNHQDAADLPTRAVYFLGIAFPADRQVYVDGVYRQGGGSLGARPVDIGRIPGGPAATSSPAARRPALTPNREDEPVRMFALPNGGAWPDGIYRFDIYTRDGLPGQMFACIRP